MQLTPSKETILKLNNYANGIYRLSHLQLFNNSSFDNFLFESKLNQTEILSCLVDSMALTTQKDVRVVSLSLE